MFKVIRQQPRHVREILFALSVITTISLVGIIWINSLKKNLYVMLNPKEAQEDQRFVENNSNPSLFSGLFKGFSDLKAEIGGVFGGGNAGIVSPSPTPDDRTARPLPVSGNK